MVTKCLSAESEAWSSFKNGSAERYHIDCKIGHFAIPDLMRLGWKCLGLQYGG